MKNFFGRQICDKICQLFSLAFMGQNVNFPSVLDPSMVGEYPATAKSGGGYVWDAVLEYRVWCHPKPGAADQADDSDYYYAFDNYHEAKAFSLETEGAKQPLALVLQREYISVFVC